MTELKTTKKQSYESPLLILHDIRSVINVGALFRTADAVGIKTIVLSGVTPGPTDRFGRKRADFAKSALGAEDFVPWSEAKNILSLADVILELPMNGKKESLNVTVATGIVLYRLLDV